MNKVKCRHCDNDAEYFVGVKGQKVKRGLCRDCYERQVFMANQLDHSLDGVDRHQRAHGSGHSGGTGYKSIFEWDGN